MRLSEEARRGWDGEEPSHPDLDLEAACRAMEERYGPGWRETTDVADVRRLADERRLQPTG